MSNESDNNNNNISKGISPIQFWIPVIIIYVGLFLFEYFWLGKKSEKFFGIELNWGWLALFLQGFYTYKSLEQVGPTEIGAKLFFGNPIEEVGPGLAFVPWGIVSLVKETALIIQEQYPDDPEKVWKGDSDKMPLDGKFVQPIRMTHKGGTGKESEADPLNKRMTTEVSIIVRYRIKKGQYITFLQTVGDTTEARRQIRDSVVATGRKEFARRTPAETLAGWEDMDDLLKGDVKELVKPWGIEIDDVRMEDVDLGKTVNTSLRDIPNSALQKEVTKTKADGEEYKRTHEGMGTAKAREVFLEAEAIGLKKVASELKITEGSLVLAMETAKTAMEKSKYSIVSGSDGMKDIFNIATAIQSILPKIKKEVEVTETKESQETKKEPIEEKKGGDK